MRADRLLSIVLLLQSRGRLTARQLAEQLEVSERTIHRDMEALGAAGIPVLAERGSGGGWRLVDGYQTRLTGLSEAELQTLLLTPPERLLADLGLQEAARAALLKLLAALPSARRDSAEDLRQRIYIDASGWHRSSEDISALPVVQEAVWQGCRLRFAYRRSEGDAIPRIVDPLGLVVKGSVWYLVAAVDDQPRTYRVSRIQNPQFTGDPAPRPADFDLAAYWKQNTADFIANLPAYLAQVRASPEALPRLRFAGHFARVEQVDPPDEAGWSLVTLRFDVEREACAYALSFGPEMEVIAPDTLRQQVIEKARATLAFYTARDLLQGR